MSAAAKQIVEYAVKRRLCDRSSVSYIAIIPWPSTSVLDLDQVREHYRYFARLPVVFRGFRGRIRPFGGYWKRYVVFGRGRSFSAKTTPPRVFMSSGKGWCESSRPPPAAGSMSCISPRRATVSPKWRQSAILSRPRLGRGRRKVGLRAVAPGAISPPADHRPSVVSWHDDRIDVLGTPAGDVGRGHRSARRGRASGSLSARIVQIERPPTTAPSVCPA